MGTVLSRFGGQPMHIERNGDVYPFPMLPEIEGESFFERLERSRRADQEETERAKADEERHLAKEAGVRIPLGRSGNLGHRRHRVTRPATAGKW